jgi:hypothetical protein
MGGHVSKFQWGSKQASKQAHFGQIEKRKQNAFIDQGLMQVFKRTCVAMRPEKETSEIDWVISPIRMLNGSIFTCFANST